MIYFNVNDNFVHVRITYLLYKEFTYGLQHNTLTLLTDLNKIAVVIAVCL